MKARIIIIIMLQAILLGCSSLDFFQYRENTGLYVVDKPDGYGTVKFGAQIAASGDAEEDYMAVSGGQGTSTLLYRLSKNGKLADVTDYELDYPGGATDLVKADALVRGSGASLTGLPLFFNKGKQEKGCMAIGESNEGKVTIWCQSIDDFVSLSNVDNSISNFGMVSAPIRLANGSQFLLAAGGSNGFQIFSDTKDDNGYSNVVKLENKNDFLMTLAGGILQGDNGEADIIFIAAAAADEETGIHSVYLYLQSRTDPAAFSKEACMMSSDNSGFGGAMVARDLDSDGTDELVVGSSDIGGKHDNAVRILDIKAVLDHIDDSTDCEDIADDEIPILATIEPEEGDLDVVCEDDCSFGSALAVGDIAVDDDGPELIVGAYRAEVDGVSKAGAVYIYRGWERTDDKYEDVSPAGQVADSTPEKGKEFGGNVAVAPMAGRNELLISATGEGKVFIAFCTGVGKDINDGADVTRDGDGKLVSTRCRL